MSNAGIGVNINIVIDGFDEVSEVNARELDIAIATMALAGHSYAIRRIQGGPARSGRKYRRQKKNGPASHHIASAQGEFPSTDSGQLVSAIHWRKIGPKTFQLGSSAWAGQGFLLEMKAPSKGGRPWLSRTFDYLVKNLSKFGLDKL